MNRTTLALITKFVATFIAAWIAFRFIGGNPLSHVFMVSLLGTALNYVIGDLIVLPKLGNFTASIGDGILAALTAYFYAVISTTFAVNLTMLITFAAIVAVAEYAFHIYLLRDPKVAP